jgi:hypothetical protein
MASITIPEVVIVVGKNSLPLTIEILDFDGIPMWNIGYKILLTIGRERNFTKIPDPISNEPLKAQLNRIIEENVRFSDSGVIHLSIFERVENRWVFRGTGGCHYDARKQKEMIFRATQQTISKNIQHHEGLEITGKGSLRLGIAEGSIEGKHMPDVVTSEKKINSNKFTLVQVK